MPPHMHTLLANITHFISFLYFNWFNVQPIDLVSPVKELHTLSSLELSRLIRDADNDTIQWTASDGSSKQIGVENLARYLAWNLVARFVQCEQDEELFRYLLGGVRLLHALCDLAPRSSKLEQVLLEDVKVSEQMLDLIFFTVHVLSRARQDSKLFLLQSALLASNLYLLTAFVSAQWYDLSLVLLAHPKVDRFVYGAFVAVKRDIQVLQVKLSAQYAMQSDLSEVNHLCQHCEASLQFLQSLCQQTSFRERLVKNKTEVLTTIFWQPHVEFLSSWCSSESRPSEEDATLDYDSLAAAGWVLGVLPSSDVPEPTFNACRVARTSYAFQRTSLLVKVVANLTCFIPDICKEEKDLFLNTFLQCFQKELSNLPYGVPNNSRAERAAIVTQNLRALFIHAESLIPGFLNQDDLQLFRLFIAQLELVITQETSIDRAREINGGGQESPDASGKDGNQNEGITDHSHLEENNQFNLNGNEDPANGLPMHDQRTDVAQTVPGGVLETDGDAQNVVTNGLDLTTTQQSEEKQLRKRKRNIMNHTQITMLEQALQNEPEMQRKAASVQLWAEKISLHGSEISFSQLKNWLNNRKAKLARTAAAKDVPAPSRGDNVAFKEKQGGSGTEPESSDECFEPNPSTTQVTQRNPEAGTSVKHEPGQFVVLTDVQGEEIGKGCVHRASGIWSGTNLDESGLCVVDVTYLKVDKWSSLPHPCDATGASFGHAEQINGIKRVLWDSTKLVLSR